MRMATEIFATFLRTRLTFCTRLAFPWPIDI